MYIYVCVYIYIMIYIYIYNDPRHTQCSNLTEARWV